MKELEQAIRGLILDIYKKHYTGKLKIEKLDPVGYRVEFGLQTPEKPLVIAALLPYHQFIEFIKNELRTRRFNLSFYGELHTVYPDLTYDHNDNRRVDRAD